MRRLLLILLISNVIGISRAQVQLDMPIDYKAAEQTIVQILDSIENKYPIQFFYRHSWLPKEAVSVDFQATPLNQVLISLLGKESLGYTTYLDFGIVISPRAKLAQTYDQAYYLDALEQAERITDTLKSSMLIYIGDSTSDAKGDLYVRGTIYDRDSDLPIHQARIRVQPLGIQTLTDKLGEYRVKVPAGDHLFTVEANGYEPYEQTLRIFSTGVFDVEMDPPFYSLGEVELSARGRDANIRSVQPGLVQISMESLKEIPALLGEADVIKGLMIQPGVTTAGESASGFNVRGGNIDQNLVMQDGAMIFNSSHVLGFFSVFNGDMVNRVSLYKGHIPAQYGGRVASVLDVQTKEGSYKKIKGEGGVGLVSSRFVLHGPLKKDKTSLIGGFRAFYPGWVLGLFRNQLHIKQSNAYFVDGNLRLDHKFSDTRFLTFSAYSSYDFFRYSDEFGYTWASQAAALSYRHFLNEKWSSNSVLSGGRYQSTLFSPLDPGAFELTTGISNIKFRQQFLYSPQAKNSLFFGLEGTNYLMRPETIGPYRRSLESTILPFEIAREKGLEMAAFANWEYSLNTFVSFSLGLRYSHYLDLGPGEIRIYQDSMPRRREFQVETIEFPQGSVISNYGGLEPRASLRVLIDETASMKASFGRHRQYVHLLSNTSAATPVDIWQLSNAYLPPQISNNYSLGYFKNFQHNQWQSSLDVYYRDMPSLIDYKDLPELLLNAQLETELIQARGRAYGAEFSIKKTAGVWQGDFSYTYSRALRQANGAFIDEVINEGDWYPASFDSPHNLNLSVRRKFRKSTLLSMNFVYRSGRPITAPVTVYQFGEIDVPHFSPRNLFRIPHYHRLDLAYTIRPNLIKRQSLKYDFTFSIYNLYFRKNPFTLFFRKSDIGIPNTYRLAVLGSAFPSISWNFRF